MLDGFDFLTSDFFNAVLREQKSILIHPYVAPEKLNLFLTVLPCYSIIEIDVSDMDMEETFEWMIHSYSAEPKDAKGLAKPLLFLTNLTASQAKRLSREEEMHFIAIVKEPIKEEDIGSSRVLVYNRKLGSFTNYTPKSREPEAFEDFIVQKLKETQNHTAAKKIITELIQKAKKIYEFLILDDFDSLYPEIQTLNPIQKDFVKDFLNSYFRITIDSELFNPTITIAQPEKLERVSEDNRIQHQKTPSKSAVKEKIEREKPNKIQNSASQLKSPKHIQEIEHKQSMSKASEIEPSQGQIRNGKEGTNKIPKILAENELNENNSNRNRTEPSKKETKTPPGHKNSDKFSEGTIKECYLKELKAIRASKIGIGQIFDYCLDSMRFLDGFNELKDPQTLYHRLRESKWKSGIPSQFLLELYRTKINSTFKSYPNLSKEDYILLLEETRKDLLATIKNVPKAQDFEIELEEYIQRILKQREFQEIREEMKENIQNLKSSYSDHLNQKYKDNHIEIIPLGLNGPTHISNISNIPSKMNNDVAESKPDSESRSKSNPANRTIDTQSSNGTGRNKKTFTQLEKPKQHIESNSHPYINETPSIGKGMQTGKQNTSRSFSESISKLNEVMNRLEICLKYITHPKNKEEAIQ
jgi:hypothetical protein